MNSNKQNRCSSIANAAIRSDTRQQLQWAINTIVMAIIDLTMRQCRLRQLKVITMMKTRSQLGESLGDGNKVEVPQRTRWDGAFRTCCAAETDRRCTRCSQSAWRWRSPAVSAARPLRPRSAAETARGSPWPARGQDRLAPESPCSDCSSSSTCARHQWPVIHHRFPPTFFLTPLQLYPIQLY